MYSRVRQGVRLARFGSALTIGTALIEASFAVPAVSNIHGKRLSDTAWFPHWAAEVGRSLNLRLHQHGMPLADPCLIVSNHVSWIDVVTASLCQPVSFISKDDVRTWPWAGRFTKRMDTVYINRNNKFQAYRSIPAIEDKLLQGGKVLLFPEGTTTSGTTVLPFKPLFFEAAVRTGVPVQGMAIKYTDESGNVLPEVSYADGDGFFETLLRTLYLNKVQAHVYFFDPLDSREYCRKQLAAITQRQVETCLFGSEMPC